MYMHTVCVCALFVCMCACCLVHTKCLHCVSPTLCRVAGRNSLNASPTSCRAEMAMVGSTVSCREGGGGGSVLHAAIHAVEGSVLITYTVHIHSQSVTKIAVGIH